MIDKGKLVIRENQTELADFLLDYWQKISLQSIERQGRFTVALSGGSTPLLFYQNLGKSRIKGWEKTHFFLADERYVEPDHVDSNYHLINQNLLIPGRVSPAQIHMPDTHLSGAQACASQYEKDLQHFFQLTSLQLPVFDLILLGIGNDGHTASLFPGEPVLDITQKLTAAVSHSAVNHQRITLTLPVLNHARQIIFLVSGHSKAPVIAGLLGHEPCSYPAALVKNKNRIYLLDQAAASQLAG